MKQSAKRQILKIECVAALVVIFHACGIAAAEDAAAPATTNETAAATAAAPAAKDGFSSAGSKLLSISYGYVTTDYEDVNTDAEGWRVSGTYEMNPTGGPLVHGLTIGYMETSAERTGAQTVNYEAKTIPIYYAPKIIVGKKAIKVFAKGAFGCHFTEYSRSGFGGDASEDEFGLFGGASVGAMIVLKEKFFLNAEYEWVYMSNTYFQDGAVQTAMIGVGMKL